MNPASQEKLIVGAGITVLALSLVLPLIQRVADEYDLSEVAVRAVELKTEVLSSAAADKSLGQRVGQLVDGISPDAALAEAAPGETSTDIVPPYAADVQPDASAPIDAMRVVAEWSNSGRAKMRVDEATRTKNWTWEAPAPQLASPGQ